MSVSSKLQHKIRQAQSTVQEAISKQDEADAEIALQDALSEPNLRLRLEKLNNLERKYCDFRSEY